MVMMIMIRMGMFVVRRENVINTLRKLSSNRCAASASNCNRVWRIRYTSSSRVNCACCCCWARRRCDCCAGPSRASRRPFVGGGGGW
jgi:hypothetical protein